MTLPLVALDRINVHLDGRHVLHDVSWRLRAGEQWAIVGANGSGKSTLLRVIRGDLWPDADGGTRAYALDGTPQAVRAAAASIGYVSPEQQERYVRLQLAIRGWALIASGLHDTTYVHGTPAPDELAKIERIVDRLGVRELADRPVGELSFGQLRMLLIARALVPSPRVLVLDECTNGLDRRSRAELLAFLAHVAGDTHVIAASHRYGDLPETTTAHAIVAGGRIVEVGEGRPRHPPRARRASTALAADTPNGRGGDVLVAIRGADVYRGETRVLHGVDWTIRRGEHTAIRGANGTGKSTFAALLTGAVPAAYGADVVRFGEREPFDVRALKQRIVHVSDELQLAYDVDPTVEQVVASGFTASIGMIERPDDAARAVVTELLARLQLQALSGRRFKTLSFGERRKVLIARGLVRRPDILILDEIWSGLDTSFRVLLETLLDELLARGTTLVAISHHDDDLPAFVARVFEIENGRLTASSSPASR